MKLQYNETFKRYLTEMSTLRIMYPNGEPGSYKQLQYKDGRLITYTEPGTYSPQLEYWFDIKQSNFWIKRSVDINDAEFIYGLGCIATTVLGAVMGRNRSGERMTVAYTCHHEMKDPFDEKLESYFEDAELKNPNIKSECYEAAVEYYSMLFSMLSSGARLDKNCNGRMVIKFACCYETAGFLLAYAGLYPESEQSQVVIPFAFSDKMRIFDKPIEKQRLLKSVKEWIPTILASSLSANKNSDSAFVQASSTVLQSDAMFEKFKTFIPNLSEPDSQISLIDSWSNKHIKWLTPEEVENMQDWSDRKYYQGPDSSIYNGM